MSDEPNDAGRQKSESARLTAKRLREEARALAGKARVLAEEASHLHREALAKWGFIVTCPNGHEAIQTEFNRQTICGWLRQGNPIPLHCVICDQWWDATSRERTTLEWAIRNGQ